MFHFKDYSHEYISIYSYARLGKTGVVIDSLFYSISHLPHISIEKYAVRFFISFFLFIFLSKLMPNGSQMFQILIPKNIYFPTRDLQARLGRSDQVMSYYFNSKIIPHHIKNRIIQLDFQI